MAYNDGGGSRRLFLVSLVGCWPRAGAAPRCTCGSTWLNFAQCIDARGQTAPSARRFIQVGAYGGSSPNAEMGRVLAGWEGLLIEADPDTFEALTRTRCASGSPHLCVNRAICPEGGGNRTFFRLSPDVDRRTLVDRRTGATFPPYVAQLGSFVEGHIESHWRAWRAEYPRINISEYVVRTPVRCASVAELLEEPPMRRFRSAELLLIDTEGMDGEIARSALAAMARGGSADATARGFAPTFLVFERRHLSADDAESALRALRARGFRTARTRADIVRALGARVEGEALPSELARAFHTIRSRSRKAWRRRPCGPFRAEMGGFENILAYHARRANATGAETCAHLRCREPSPSELRAIAAHLLSDVPIDVAPASGR